MGCAKTTYANKEGKEGENAFHLIKVRDLFLSFQKAHIKIIFGTVIFINV